MPDILSPEMPGAAVLRSQAIDLEDLTTQQMHNIYELRQMANLMFDNARTITERQAAFFKVYAEQMGGAFESEDGMLDKKAIFVP